MKKWSKRLLTLGASFALVASPFSYAKAESASTTASAIFKEIREANLEEKHVDTKKYSEDTFIVKYNKALTASEHRKAGGKVIQQITSLKYVAVKVTNKKKLQQTIQNYQKNSKVDSVQLSPIGKKFGAVDPKISEQYVHTLLKTSDAQKLAGKNQVKVAVIDTGIDMNHPELKGSVTLSKNILDPMNAGIADDHGTHVAGIIAAKKNNGVGGYGIHPDSKILSYDVFNGNGGWWTSDYAVATAILDAADQGAKVINMSLGFWAPSDLLEEAVQAAIDKGVVVVAAAGNDGMDYNNYPASFEGVISVGSINNSKKLSSFSTYGASVDLVAPGENIYAPLYDGKSSTFAHMSGTSMASPAVAGAAALLLSKHPKLKPIEVEYILEKTAADLGAKGFDAKYGNGLVNPVAALKYDVKKVPKFVKETWDKKKILDEAEQVVSPATVKHSFTKPSEQKWIKFNVEEGEYIQATLQSLSSYDYKMSIHFYSENEEQKMNINDVKEGKSEGKLIQAPFSGTAAIGVSDVNGSFDDSSFKRSSITLQVDKLASLPEDESTLEAPLSLSGNQAVLTDLYFTGEEGDDDFFRFTANDAQLMKLDVSGIPGVDISALVYEKEMLFPSPEELAIYEEMGIPYNIDEVDALQVSNSGGIGQGETLYFSTEPGKEYYIRVTSKPIYFEGEMSLIEFLYGSSNSKPAQSALPYSVKLQGKVIPADEDGFTGETPYNDEAELIAQLESTALPYELGEKLSGYLQNEIDLDIYSIRPTKSAVYQFDIKEPSDNMATVELYEVVSDVDEEGKPYKYLSFLTSNVYMDWYSWVPEMQNKIVTGLKANKQYYLVTAPNYNSYQIPYEGYEVASKPIFTNVEDQYEENDTPEKAKNYPKNGATGNFAMPNDVDFFYFTAPETGVFSAKFENTTPSATLIKKYGADLLSPFIGYLTIIEDKNKNRKLDGNEASYATYVENISPSGLLTTGSFQAQKGKAYFVAVIGYTEAQMSLLPYTIKIESVNRKDEDAGSKVKNNKPSKPISLKKHNSKSYSKTAYLNAGYKTGDTDWFVFKSSKKQQATITFAAGESIDGIIEIYKDGKRVAYSNHYSLGDDEVVSLNMTKGTYYIKVRDSKGRSTVDPYKLSMKLK